MPPKKRKPEEDGDGQEKKAKTEKTGENGSAPAVVTTVVEEEDEDAEAFKLEGSLISGELLFCGGTNWDLVGRKTLPKGAKNIGGRNLYGPHILSALSGIRVRTVAAGCVSCHSIVITTEGKAYSWGRNDQGQLGHGDILRKDNPSLIESLESLNIIDAACGRSHSLVLSDRGHVYAFGENKMGQLGLGHQTAQIPSPTRVKHSGPPVRKMACGAEFSMIVDVRGNLFSFGLPEYGQLGHNTDGKYFQTSTKLSYDCEKIPRKVVVFIEKTRDGQILPLTDVEVDDVACGPNHTIITDRKKRVFTWGFGGYGRLGHSEPKDEMVPRLLKTFDGQNRGAVSIAAGSAFSLIVNEMGCLYLCGTNKPTGEASMYPKPIQDLSGWKIRSMACGNRSIVVVADESVVSWGPSPTWGELGYGEGKAKSSTIPQEAKPFAKVYVHKVACGYAHTLLIARNDSDEDKETIAEFPVYDP